MCGICGIWGKTDNATIRRMVASLYHRGPDFQGLYSDEHVALGMTRLSVIDVTSAGNQPMRNPDGLIWIVYNGEIYNFREERKILEEKGYCFRSTSDTEVVLQMYEYYGDDFLLRLRGMFALAIYDKRFGPGNERLVLARDQIGIKPLLISRVNGKILFASELKALIASEKISTEIDPVSLRLLLSYGSVYQPYTMLKEVKMLPPAHRLILEKGRERLERYWSLDADRKADLQKLPYEELVEAVGDVLKESVRLQMVSDVPLGAFLSGGVDSSILVAIMREVLGQRVKTFSVGFEAEGSDMDESRDAQRTADFLRTDHHHVLVKGEEVRDRIHHIAHSLDQPSVDGVNSYFISMAARKGVTVSISGTGGDELFAGYPWFINMVRYEQKQKDEPWKAIAGSFISTLCRQRILDRFLLLQGGGKLQTLRNYSGFLSKYATNYQIYSPREAARLMAPEMRQEGQACRSPHFDLIAIDELPEGSVLNRVSALCLRGYTNNQLLRDIDAVSMAHSLEVRVPYLDPVVIDTALSLPDKTKLGSPNMLLSAKGKTYRETGAKRILIDVGRQFLPQDFDRQPKRGFNMPFDAWLKKEMKAILLDTLSEEVVRMRGLLDVRETAKVRKSYLEGCLSWVQPWALMMLELWCREVLSCSCMHQKKLASKTNTLYSGGRDDIFFQEGSFPRKT